MVGAINFVNLGEGDPVDPEDWSPEHAQELEPLAPGESVEQSRTINAILAGDYLANMTVIPEPEGDGRTNSPVSSPDIRFVVAAYAPLTQVVSCRLRWACQSGYLCFSDSRSS